MKRLIFLIGCVAVFAAFQIVANCSSPLDSENITIPPGPNPGVDTVYIFDTVTTVDTTIVFDSVIVIDTITGIDTVIVVDTLEFFDTVIVTDTTVLTDTVFISDTVIVYDTVTIGGEGSVTICSEIYSKQKKIDWTFLGIPGEYQLTFVGDPARLRPTKALVISVDGEKYYWDLTDSETFDFEADFGEVTNVTIMSDPPHAYGNGVKLCLTIEPR